MKRKIKLLFIAISICAMLFAFAISSSAESTCEIVWYFPEGTSIDTIQVATDEYNFKCEFEGSFTYLIFDAKDNDGYNCDVIALNVVEFQNFCKLYNLTDISSFNSFMNSLNLQHNVEGGSYEIYNWSSPFTYVLLNEESFNFFYNYNLITQDDVDSAVDEAVAKALADAGLAMTSDTFVHLLSGEVLDGVDFKSEGMFDFGEYSIAHMSQSDLNGARCCIVFGARAFYNDITANMDFENQTIFDYLCSKREDFDGQSWAHTYSEGIYNALAESLVEVPSADDLQAKYDEGYAQGEADGVTEYKSSEEYATALNNQYSTGYDNGVEGYKQSTAYSDALDLQYSQGKTAGVTEYKASTEYANSLKAEYNEGYDNGVADTEGENTKNTTTRLVSILIGVLGFGILFLGVLSAVGTFKKKRKHR